MSWFMWFFLFAIICAVLPMEYFFFWILRTLSNLFWGKDIKKIQAQIEREVLEFNRMRSLEVSRKTLDDQLRKIARLRSSIYFPSKTEDEQ